MLMILPPDARSGWIGEESAGLIDLHPHGGDDDVCLLDADRGGDDALPCQIASNRDPHFASNHDPCEVLGLGLSM